MVFDPINSEEISAGEPTKQELFTKTKDNFDDHESRITTNEGAVNAFLPIPDGEGIDGRYGVFTSGITAFHYFRITFNLTITAARLLIITAGGSGSTEVDVLFDRGAGFGGNSIFTTKPSVAFSDGDLAFSVNAVLDGTKKLLEAGDLIRYDLTAVQGGTPNPNSFKIFLEYDKT